MHVHWPAWSSDGHIYFIRTFTTIVNLDASEIYRIRADGAGTMEPVIETLRRALHPALLPASRGLIYSANPTTAELGLWWTSLDRRRTRRLTTGVGEYAEARTSADGRTLVATLYDLRQSLVRVTVNSEQPTVTGVTDGLQGDLDPVVSPAGDRLAFSSARDGNRHIWTARLDASEARPLTSGDGQDDRPAYSPDGRQIAFVSDRGADRAIWIVAADGGPPRKVVSAVPTGGLTWSRDGRRIVYTAGAGAGPVLWSVSIEGGAAERLETQAFASEPAWAPDRDLIAYMAIQRRDGVSVTKVAFVDPTGRPGPELPEPPGGNGFSNGMVAWSPDGRRLAAVQQQANSACSIWIVDPDSAQPYRRLFSFPPGPRIRGISFTRDGEALLVGKHDWTSDIVLLDAPR